MNKLYRNVVPEQAVHITYELMLALIFLRSHKSFMVGRYPIVAMTPTLAYAIIKICNNNAVI